MSDGGDRPLILEARDVRAGYGEVLALDGVTFGVPRHEVVALLGSNGAGKSSLLSVLSGDLQPVSGAVFFNGEPLGGRPAWEIAELGICAVPEGGGLFYELTVRENLQLAASACRGSTGRVSDALDLFPKLGQRQKQLAGSLSGGEKQMLALSRAVVTKPKVLLVDEPSLGLAPIIVDSVFEVIERLNRETAMSVVVVEQYVERALGIARWAFLLQKGRIRFAGSVEDLRSSGALADGYLGGMYEDQGDPLAPATGQGPAERSPTPRRTRSRRSATRPQLRARPEH